MAQKCHVPAGHCIHNAETKFYKWWPCDSDNVTHHSRVGVKYQSILNFTLDNFVLCSKHVLWYHLLLALLWYTSNQFYIVVTIDIKVRFWTFWFSKHYRFPPQISPHGGKTE